MRILVFDVESDGLYGEGFAVGACVVEDGVELSALYCGCPYVGNNRWVQQNVLPNLPPSNCESPKEVRQKFWEYLEMWKASSKVFADCGSPVEAKFLRDCVMDDFENRQWEAPYPLHEAATVFLLTGLDPLGSYDRLPHELVHNPLGDARQSARLISQSLGGDAPTPEVLVDIVVSSVTPTPGADIAADEIVEAVGEVEEAAL